MLRRPVSSRRPKYRPTSHIWVYDQVQIRLGEHPMDCRMLHTYIEEIESVICNYINRDYVPEPLKFVFVNMVMDLLKSLSMNGMVDNPQLAELGIGSLTQVEDGDTNLKFSTSQTFSGSHVGNIDGLIYNYTMQLDKYRLLKW